MSDLVERINILLNAIPAQGVGTWARAAKKRLEEAVVEISQRDERIKELDARQRYLTEGIVLDGPLLAQPNLPPTAMIRPESLEEVLEERAAYRPIVRTAIRHESIGTVATWADLRQAICSLTPEQRARVEEAEYE